jgi:putative SOS response-associated peptidase YedK
LPLRQKLGRDLLESFTIVTRPANAFMRQIHDRMPLILGPERASAWLRGNSIGRPVVNPSIVDMSVAPASGSDNVIADLSDGAAFGADFLDEIPRDVLRAYAVSTQVNSPKNEGPELIRPL